MTPRVLFVGRTRYRLPLGESLARKWDALSQRMEVRVLASGTGSDPRFRLVAPRRRTAAQNLCKRTIERDRECGGAQAAAQRSRHVRAISRQDDARVRAPPQNKVALVPGKNSEVVSVQ